MPTRLGTIQRSVLLAVLLLGVVVLQYSYDTAKPVVAQNASKSAVSPEAIRMADMGFHAVIASFYWAGTMPEILDFFRGRTEYLTDAAFVNGIDPKLTYPYAFSVLTLPAVTVFPDAVKDSFVFGQQGIANGDPDWRIPYYMATNYFLEVKDNAKALEYYDLAARTPGIPDYAKRFALNFGISNNLRNTTRDLWTSIRDTTNDEFTKERAQAYIDRLNIFDYLEAAATVYKKRFGTEPASVDALVAKGIIPAVPQDPFGFYFVINPDGQAGIDLSRYPVGFTSSTTQ